MGYNNEKLEKLVTVSLLYDIGMVCEDNPIFMNEVFNNPLYDKFNLQKKGFNLIHILFYKHCCNLFQTIQSEVLLQLVFSEHWF